MKKTIITSDGKYAVTFKSKGPEFVNEPVGHTPGPWKIGKSETTEMAIREPDGECVAVACELPEMKANARLIAAAPELLDILKTLLQEDDTVVSAKSPHSVYTIQKAMDILDKIEGKQ